VLNEPTPHALFSGFGESSLDFNLRIWCLFQDHLRIASEVRTHIAAALEEAGITIPFPQRDVHLRRESGAVDTAASDLPISP
jgi:small-conductance mechanosensitive channel